MLTRREEMNTHAGVSFIDAIDRRVGRNRCHRENCERVERLVADLLTRGARLRTTSGIPSQPVGRTPHSQRSSIEHVRVHHRRRHVRMPQQLLHRSDVVAVLEKVSCEGVAQRILTLPMNRFPRSFTTVTIPSSVNT